MKYCVTSVIRKRGSYAEKQPHEECKQPDGLLVLSETKECSGNEYCLFIISLSTWDETDQTSGGKLQKCLRTGKTSELGLLGFLQTVHLRNSEHSFQDRKPSCI